MTSLDGAVAFFDIGNTLASVTRSPDSDRIELAVFGFVPPVLGELREKGVRLGIISDRGPIPAAHVNEALMAAGLWDFLTPELVVYGKKDTPHVFEQAAALVIMPDPGRRPLFVGEDERERAQALLAGFLVAAHPRAALTVLEQHAPG
jgi:FMN phosphatase YigB (HAD superfamily)